MAKRTIDEMPVYLRELYASCGYTLYRTPAFEEYDLFTPYRDFLTGGKMVTFSGAGGRLLALKPDITMSIIRDTAEGAGRVDKYYYSENVYRLPAGADEFREILQIGLEAVGDLSEYDRVEAIALACRTLAATGREFRLDISHTGLVSGLFSMFGVPDELCEGIADALKNKNAPELRRLGTDAGLNTSACNKLIDISRLSLPIIEAAPRLRALGLGDIENSADAISMLEGVASALDADEARCVFLDFSVIHGMNYYDGAVFAGYVDGISECLLRGGEYGRLILKMGRSGSGIGFAVYADLLERLDYGISRTAADILLVCGDCASSTVAKAVKILRADGNSVLVQKSFEGSERCGKVLVLDSDGAFTEVK